MARIHGCRIEERDTDDAWFSKHMGNINTRFVQDLEVVKKLCEPCFPPSYRLFDYFLTCVQELISEYIQQLLDTKQLSDQEFFILMSWLDTYKSEYFMGHPSLGLDVSKLSPVLDDKYYQMALAEHMIYTEKRISVWFKNAMDKNIKEWHNNTQPHSIDGTFESSMPNDINTMLIQQVRVFHTIQRITFYIFRKCNY